MDIMVRSILLRGFDQEIAEKIGDFMKLNGVNFIRPTVPEKVELTQGGRKLVTYKDPSSGATRQEEYDTVLVATGR